MKRLFIAVFALSLIGGLSACSSSTNGQNSNQAKTSTSQKAHQSATLKTQKDKFSYAVGMDIGKSLSRYKDKIELDDVVAGLRDRIEGNDLKLTSKEKQKVIMAYVKKIRAEKQKEKKQEAAKNAKASKAFLAKNKKKKGVKTTDDGLQYQVLKKGNGPKPTKDDVVVVKYKGMLPDGTVFDSSYKRKKPATFPVKNVIPGWTEALQLMHVGSKYRLVIPAKLAYGKRGAGNKIGPNQALVFEVQLVSIKKKDADKKGSDKSSKKSSHSKH